MHTSLGRFSHDHNHPIDAKAVGEHAVAWRAQLRLCARYRRLSLRGKVKQQIVTAIARELSAFMWAIAREVPVS